MEQDNADVRKTLPRNDIAMIIIHVHHSYYPVIGGIENAIKNLAEEQAKLRHEVHIVTSIYGAPGRPREEEINGVHVHRVKAWRPHYPDLTIPREFPVELLKRADIVHIHSQNSLFNISIAKKAKALGVKIATHFMAVNALNDHPNPIIKALGPIYGKWALNETLKITDLTLVRSLRDAEQLRQKLNHGEIHHVPDGVSKELLTTPRIDREFREKFGIDNDVVLFIGRLHPLKGIDVLIKAVPNVLREVKDIDFIIIGPGDKKPYVELADRLGVNKHVKFLGYVDERTKIGAIDSAACLVLPSVSNYVEVYPMVISEAWAREKPVVATTVGGIPYRVKHGTNGLLVRPKDPEALAKAIVTLIQNKELAEQMGRNGKTELKTWREIAIALIQLYQNVRR